MSAKDQETVSPANVQQDFVPVDSERKEVRGWDGLNLKEMFEMPADVQYEILGGLHPRDLLSLSWTSKACHAALSTKDSAYLWTVTLRNVPGVPPCPDLLIEPAWATLLYSPHCTGCGYDGSTEWYWEFYVRFCDNCRHTRLVWDPHYDRRVSERRNLSLDIPTNILNARRVPPNPYYPRELRNVYMKSEIDDLIDAWVKVVKEDDDEAMATLVGQQFVRVRKTAKHVALCEKWAEAECVELRKERLRDVVSRLREVGWGDKLDLMKEDNYAPLSKLAEVNVPEKLTDTAWSNVGREIIKGMESAQTRRLARELDEKLHSRADIMESTIKSLLRRPELWPYRVGFGDIARMPEVREIMCAPDSEDIDAKFAALPTQFGDMIRRWKAHVDDQLLNKYVPDFDEYEYPRRAKSYKRLLSLDLATTRFRCERCAVEFGWDCDLYYPSVLSHDCLHGETEWMDDETDTVYAHFVEEYVGSEGFYTYRLHAVPLTTQARKLFELCGKDTDTVTAQEMDALGVRFVRDEEYIMTWRAATSSSQGPDGTWRMATSGEASKAQKHERRIQLEEARWFCRTCDEPQHARGWYCRDALRHLATMHGGVTLSLECEHLQALPGYDKSQDDFRFKLDSLDSDEKAKRVYQL